MRFVGAYNDESKESSRMLVPVACDNGMSLSRNGDIGDTVALYMKLAWPQYTLPGLRI